MYIIHFFMGEPADFEVMVGASSDDIRLKDKIATICADDVCARLLRKNGVWGTTYKTLMQIVYDIVNTLRLINM